MRPAAAIHAIALTALFAAHLAFAHELAGVRRALQTFTAAETQMAPLPQSPVFEAA